MTNHKPVITQLESLDDLGLLMQGDAVQIEHQYEGLDRKVRKDEYIAAYHGKTPKGLLQFLVPIRKMMSEEYLIRMYQAQKELIQIKDGKIIFSESKGIEIEPFYSERYEYKGLNKTLKTAGLK